MVFTAVALSKAGGRDTNEDYGTFVQLERFGCWVVADGLGGHECGEIASRIAVERVLAAFRSKPELNGDTLKGYIADAQSYLNGIQKQVRKLSSMRTTIVILASDFDTAMWAHVGDSRLYHFRLGCIDFQTKDHSVCQALVNCGEITPHQIRFHEDRNRLLRALGAEEAPRIEVCAQPLTVQRGDTFLLCTDGLWEYVTETEMEIDLAKSSSPQQWLDRMEERLLQRAKAGHDNYSAIAIFVE